MKLICAILAILVLVLSVQPVCASVSGQASCCVDACCDDEQTEDHKAPEDCKNCNPFQLCGCCAFSVVVPAGFQFSPSACTTYSIVLWGSRPFALTDEPAFGFWQPPRAA